MEDDAATGRAPGGRIAGLGGGLVGFLVFVEFTSGVLQGYYVPLLTDVARHLGIHDADVNWLEAAQLMLSAIVVPIAAKLGDLHGHRRLLLITAPSPPRPPVSWRSRRAFPCSSRPGRCRASTPRGCPCRSPSSTTGRGTSRTRRRRLGARRASSSPPCSWAPSSARSVGVRSAARWPTGSGWCC